MEFEKAYFPKAVQEKETEFIEDQTELGIYWAKNSLEEVKKDLEEKLSLV